MQATSGLIENIRKEKRNRKRNEIPFIVWCKEKLNRKYKEKNNKLKMKLRN